MVLKIQKSTKKAAFILAFLMLLMSVDLVLLTAEKGEEEYRSCGEAFKECLGDNLISILLDPKKVILCVGGWIFCKKYVEKRLPEK